MKIQLNQKLKTLDGEVIKIMSGKKEIDFTLADAVMTALTSNFEDEKNLTGEEKVIRFTLAQSIQRKKNGEIDLSADDIVLIKKLIGKAYGTLVSGQVWGILK